MDRDAEASVHRPRYAQIFYIEQYYQPLHMVPYWAPPMGPPVLLPPSQAPPPHPPLHTFYYALPPPNMYASPLEPQTMQYATHGPPPLAPPPPLARTLTEPLSIDIPPPAYSALPPNGGLLLCTIDQMPYQCCNCDLGASMFPPPNLYYSHPYALVPR